MLRCIPTLQRLLQLSGTCCGWFSRIRMFVSCSRTGKLPAGGSWLSFGQKQDSGWGRETVFGRSPLNVGSDNNMGRLPALENIDDSVGGRDARPLACLDRLSGQVGGDQDVVQLPEPVAGGQRFFLDN